MLTGTGPCKLEVLAGGQSFEKKHPSGASAFLDAMGLLALIPPPMLEGMYLTTDGRLTAQFASGAVGESVAPPLHDAMRHSIVADVSVGWIAIHGAWSPIVAEETGEAMWRATPQIPIRLCEWRQGHEVTIREWVAIKFTSPGGLS